MELQKGTEDPMLKPPSSTEHGSLWWLEHESTGQLPESHTQVDTNGFFFFFFFFFTVLFITISVLFSCKGIQQKLLKRSYPQNGAARLPFLGVPHFLLIPRGGEPGGVFTKESLQPWEPQWGHWRGGGPVW